ncbi:MAG: MOSC domain-containing protein [Nitrospirae bacterium]|nr:MOSC domain-containing protein [Nitrospirota bacterium]
MIKGKVISINISKAKGMRKSPVSEVTILPDFGIQGDAHAGGDPKRQVSLLALESIKKMNDLGLNVSAGDFAENITTEGIDLLKLSVGTKMLIGDIEAEVTQIGKECHRRCSIYYQAGDCIMPKEGIFVKIFKGGSLKVGSRIRIK